MRTARDFADRWGRHIPGLMGVRDRFAVLVPLIEAPDGLRLLFEVRDSRLRQGGEVCFPGGRMEPGETPWQCALRETREELGIPQEEITLLGQTDFLVHQRGFWLQPVIGLVSPEGLAAMSPSADEVAEVFTVPAEFFRTTAPALPAYSVEPKLPQDFPYDLMGIGPDYPWGRSEVEVPVWHYEGHIIWGLTARILLHILQEMEDI